MSPYICQKKPNTSTFRIFYAGRKPFKERKKLEEATEAVLNLSKERISLFIKNPISSPTLKQCDEAISVYRSQYHPLPIESDIPISAHR